MELISEPTVSLMELISFLKSTVGSKSFLMFFKSEIDFFTSLRSFSSANSFKEFLKSREIFFSDLENEPICFKRLGISFGPTTIITTITVSAISDQPKENIEIICLRQSFFQYFHLSFLHHSCHV